MDLIDALTPKDTEEIKPGLFIQKKSNGYRNINPLVWGGKFRTKEQLRTVFNLRTFFTLGLILFIAFNYWTDTKLCREFQADPCKHLLNLTSMCSNSYDTPGIYKRDDGDYSYTNTLSSNP